MNYYERHIGDYLKDTSHLSLLEHGIYTRLLDVYYTREAGIPASDAARLIGARTKEERAALAAVLAEFFVDDQGLHVQPRADREIAAYRDGDEDREHKRDNAKERQRRTRERRKALFLALKESGVVPDWNTPIHVLEALMSRVTKADGSQPVTPPVTRDATATHTHTQTQTQYPEEKKTTTRPVVDPPAPVASVSSSSSLDPVAYRSVEIVKLLRPRGAAFTASDPRVREWAANGTTDAQLLVAFDQAQEQRHAKRDAAPINAGYLDSILAGVRSKTPVYDFEELSKL